MRETFPAVGDAIDKSHQVVGRAFGWVTTAAGILAGFLARSLLGSIIGLFRPLIGLALWIVVAFAKTLWWAGGKALVTYLGALAAKHLPKVMKAFRALTALMLKNPFTSIAAATLAVAFLIYQNWEQILGFFRGVWANIKTIWQGTKKWFTDLWQGIMDAFGVDAWIVTLEGYQEKVFGRGHRVVLRDQRMDSPGMGGDHRRPAGLGQGAARDWRCHGHRSPDRSR